MHLRVDGRVLARRHAAEEACQHAADLVVSARPPMRVDLPEVARHNGGAAVDGRNVEPPQRVEHALGDGILVGVGRKIALHGVFVLGRREQHGETVGPERRLDALAEQGHPGAQELATYFVGQGVGLMTRVRPAREVVREMAEDLIDAAERLNSALGADE